MQNQQNLHYINMLHHCPFPSVLVPLVTLCHGNQPIRCHGLPLFTACEVNLL